MPCYRMTPALPATGFPAPEEGRHVKAPIDALDLPLGSRLAKVGRTTGYTSAPAESVAIGLNDVSISFAGLGNLRFDGMIEIMWPNLKKPFSASGDSGSLCYVEKKMHAFALIVAGGVVERNGVDVGVSYACPLDAILTEYKAEVLGS